MANEPVAGCQGCAGTAGRMGCADHGAVTRLLYPGTSVIEYPFPLRPDLMARLALPRDLTKDEARRLIAFISALIPAEER